MHTSSSDWHGVTFSDAYITTSLYNAQGCKLDSSSFHSCIYVYPPIKAWSHGSIQHTQPRLISYLPYRSSQEFTLRLHGVEYKLLIALCLHTYIMHLIKSPNTVSGACIKNVPRAERSTVVAKKRLECNYRRFSSLAYLPLAFLGLCNCHSGGLLGICA